MSLSLGAAEIKLEDATIADINAAFAKGTLTSVKLTELYLARIAAYDQQGPSLNTVIAANPKAYVIDFSAVPVLDSTAAAPIEGFVRKAHRAGATVYVSGARCPIRRVLLTHGVRPPRVRFRSTLADAVAAAHGRTEASRTTAVPADA